jgi:hypothetical protein
MQYPLHVKKAAPKAPPFLFALSRKKEGRVTTRGLPPSAQAI